MKKFFSVLTAAICLTACAFSFTACGDKEGDETHTTHNWSATYTEDGDRHYQTCDGCDEKKYSNHDYGTSGVCVCGKRNPAIPVESVTLDTNTLTLEIGGTATLTATVAPNNATDKTVTWESDKTNIATVDDNGKVTAIKDGTAVITATTANGKTATCTVTVNAAVIPVESVTLNKTEITLEIDGTETLTAIVAPENATDKTVTWTVAPAGVVSVENGVVTAIKDGTATITVTTANGKTATCSVTVNAPLTNAQMLQFLNDNVLMKAARSIYAESGWDINETNIKNATWFVIKEGNNVKGANLVFTYERRINGHYINLCKVDFDKSLTPQNIKNGEIGIPTYTNLYQNIINPTIQEQHTALTNAICNKLFGENQNAIRYIIYVGSDPISGLDYDSVIYKVVEISAKSIKENDIKIGFGKGEFGDDSVLIRNLNNPSKYLLYGTDKSVAITGDKLENNDEQFFGKITPLGDKVTSEQLKAVLNAGYREKAIKSALNYSVDQTVNYSKISNENWYVTKDNYGNIINATHTFFYKDGTLTSYCFAKLTFCVSPFDYEDYQNAEKGVYKEVACTDKERDNRRIEDTATVNSYPAFVAALLKKQNITLSETAQVSYVKMSARTTNGSINGSAETYTLRGFDVYILDGDTLTAICGYVKEASSDAGFAANINSDLYHTKYYSNDWYNGIHSLIPDGEKL